MVFQQKCGKDIDILKLNQKLHKKFVMKLDYRVIIMNSSFHYIMVFEP